MTADASQERPIATAFPSWREWTQGVVVFPFAGAFFSLFIIFGIDAVLPSFLSDVPGPTNAIRMAVVWLVLTAGLFAWSVRINGTHRHYRVYADRFEVGRPARIVVPLATITRIRAGAPMPRGIAGLHRANAVVGVVSAQNRAAGSALSWAYANTVVIDVGAQSLVIHLGTVTGGRDIYQALAAQCPTAVAPAEYTAAECSIFGRFRPGVYPKPE